MSEHAFLSTDLVSLDTYAVHSQQIHDYQSRRDAVRHYFAGQEFMAGEKFAAAADEFEKAIQKDKLFTLAYYFLGQAYGNQQRYPSAIKAYTDCIEACRAIYHLRETNRFEAERRRDDDIRELRETVAV